MEPPEQDKNPVVRKLREWDAQAVAEVIEFRDETTVVVPKEKIRRVAEFLATHQSVGHTFLSDISSVDRFPLEPRFEVNYHLLSMEGKTRLRLKVRLPGNEPVIASVTSVWPTANWHERESFDLMGIRFEGHPDLKRIVMPDDWEGHPHRKDYAVEGPR